MERTAILEIMDELKLSGMRMAYDEILAGAIKRAHAPQRVVGDLLKAEIAEKQARSINRSGRQEQRRDLHAHTLGSRRREFVQSQ